MFDPHGGASVPWPLPAGRAVMARSTARPESHPPRRIGAAASRDVQISIGRAFPGFDMVNV